MLVFDLPGKLVFLLLLIVAGPLFLLALGNWLYGPFEKPLHRLQALARMLGLFFGGLVAMHVVLTLACLTEVPPPGAPPDPWWLTPSVVVAYHGVPVSIVAVDARLRRR